MKNLVKLAILGLPFVLGIGCERINDKNDMTVIPTGSYSFGQKIASYDFAGCSAIAIDYGDSAVFAHAIPGGSMDLIDYSCIGSCDVVDTLVKKLKDRGIDYSKSFAVVNAGIKQSLDSIMSDLKKYNIPVKKNIIEEEYNCKLRDVSYDAVKNIFKRHYISDKKSQLRKNIVTSRNEKSHTPDYIL
jgi:hypothetical protein